MKFTTCVLLLAILAVGVFFRADYLTQRGIYNIEIYTPNIPLPAGISDPSPRLTIAKTISGTAFEPHPPTWYLLMFPYTRLVGTSLLALRLPSVLFGAGAILLMFLLGVLVEDQATGLLGMGLLAISPLHVLWSQLSRPNSMLCLLSLLSTCLLLLVKRGGERQKKWLALYLLSALLALLSDYYFWPVFATHLLWVLLCSWKNKQWVSGLLQAQMLILILATPAISLGILQSRESYLGGDILGPIANYLDFSFLFQSSPVEGGSWIHPAALFYIMPVLAGLFLIAGCLRRRPRAPAEIQADVPAPSVVSLVLAALCALPVIIAAGALARAFLPERARPVLASTIFPVLFLLLAYLLRRPWPMAQKTSEFLDARGWLPQSGYSLVLLLLVLPVALVAGVSLFVPFMMPRGMLYFAPFLLTVMASGIQAICRLPARKFSFVLGVLLLLPVGFSHYQAIAALRLEPPQWQDYQGLGRQLVAHIKDSEPIFIVRHWELSPIYYYVPAEHYHYVGKDYAETTARNRPARVWVIRSEQLDRPKEMLDALVDYDRGVTLRAGRLWADEYLRRQDSGGSAQQK